MNKPPYNVLTKNRAPRSLLRDVLLIIFGNKNRQFGLDFGIKSFILFGILTSKLAITFCSLPWISNHLTRQGRFCPAVAIMVYPI
jgi:hypothetical protein